jgi:hypothetical protein
VPSRQWLLDKELQNDKMSNSSLNEIEAVKEIEHSYCAYELKNAGSQSSTISSSLQRRRLWRKVPKARRPAAVITFYATDGCSSRAQHSMGLWVKG